MKPASHITLAVVVGLAPAVLIGGYLVLSSAGDEAGSRTDGATAASQTMDGVRLYAEFCAACHGARLEGQPSWQQRKPDGRLPAPPHDASGHTWHHGDEVLFRITKLGPAAIVDGYKSDMPGFENVLSDDEIRAVLTFIKGTWPERERQYQELRTRAERGNAAR
ncbi:cytochrome c [Elioraea sp. Yellowstone]|jgi:mono/diheme cytochrome c family protein|nr:cytochrome c [Elioraea sp. Yellowstone]